MIDELSNRWFYSTHEAYITRTLIPSRNYTHRHMLMRMFTFHLTPWSQPFILDTFVSTASGYPFSIHYSFPKVFWQDQYS